MILQLEVIEMYIFCNLFNTNLKNQSNGFDESRLNVIKKAKKLVTTFIEGLEIYIFCNLFKINLKTKYQ